MVARFNDRVWVDCLDRARLSKEYPFCAIHIAARFGDTDGVAPVVLETSSHECLRAPAHFEASFEFCLRHLNHMDVPWPDEECVTIPTLLAKRATQALKLPGRFVPTAEGTVMDMTPPAAREAPASPAAREALPSPVAGEVPFAGLEPHEATAAEPREAIAAQSNGSGATRSNGSGAA